MYILVDIDQCPTTPHSFQCILGNSGGAVYVGGSANITLEGNSFFGNEAAANGGACLTEDSNSIILASNSLDNNEAVKRGGGVCVSRCHASVLSSNTFNSNAAEQGKYFTSHLAVVIDSIVLFM